MADKSHAGLKRLCPPPLFRALQRRANRANIRVYRAACIVYEQNPRRVLLLSPSRHELSGNLGFIYEAIKDDFDVVVRLADAQNDTAEIMEQVAQATYVIVDDYVRYMYTLPLTRGTRFIQVWHSTGAFKRMGFARMGREGSTVPASLTHRNYTDVIVSSEGVVDDFEAAFRVPRAAIRPLGVPRTDIFFDEEYAATTRLRVRTELGIAPEEHFVLFAPTYRGDAEADAFYPPEFVDFDALADGLGAGFVLGIKLHPFTHNAAVFTATPQRRILDLTAQREINDLLLAADTLVTDYSSSIFEYALLDKPIVFFAPDLAAYSGSRDFFHPFEEYLYGPLVQDAADLPAVIRDGGTTGSAPTIASPSAAFKERFLGACDGHATQRFVDVVLTQTAGE